VLYQITEAGERLSDKLDLLLVEQEFTTDASAAPVDAINALAAEVREALQ
jgi:hypothetical protein